MIMIKKRINHNKSNKIVLRNLLYYHYLKKEQVNSLMKESDRFHPVDDQENRLNDNESDLSC